MLRLRGLLCSVLAGWCLCAAASAPDSVPAIDSTVAPVPSADTAASAQLAAGLVVDVRGKGRVITRNGVSSPLELLQYVELESRIELEAGSKASVSHYASSSVYQLTGPSVTDVKAAGLSTKEGNPFVVNGKVQPLVAGARVPRLVPGGPKLFHRLPESFFENRPGYNPILFDGQSRLPSQSAPADAVGKQNQWKASPVSHITASASQASRPSGKSMKEIAALQPLENAPVEEWVLYAVLLDQHSRLAEARAVWGKIAARRPDLKAAAQYAK